jgi:hypothetical protein
MSRFEQTTFHEAGHAVARMLLQEHVGPLGYVSVLPDGDSLGKVAGAPGEHKFKGWPELRARAIVAAAGFVAVRLAGFSPGGAESDIAKLTKIAYFVEQPKRFLRQAVAGAEFILRCHWGGVKRLAARLRELGTLTGPTGLELARMAVLEGPLEPLDTDCETFERLILDLEGVPEIEKQVRAALEQLGLLPKPRKVKPARKPREKPLGALSLPRKPKRKPRYSRSTDIAQIRAMFPGGRMGACCEEAAARLAAHGRK